MLSLALALLLTGISCRSGADGPGKPHHVDGGFRNNYPHEQRGTLDYWKWWAGWPSAAERKHQRFTRSSC